MSLLDLCGWEEREIFFEAYIKLVPFCHIKGSVSFALPHTSRQGEIES